MADHYEKDELRETPFSIVREIGKIWSFLGITIAALSIISLIQNWGDITLGESARQVLEYYRYNFAAPLKTLLFDFWISRLWLNWTLPFWLFDLIALWFLCGVAAVRSSYDDTETSVFTPDSKLIRKTRKTKRRSNTIWIILLGPVSLYKAIKVAASRALWNGLIKRDDTIPLDTISEGIEITVIEHRPPAIKVILLALAPFFISAIFFIWNGLTQ